MYSRYAGYQPFVPLNNRLSRFREDERPVEHGPVPPPYIPEHSDHGSVSQPSAGGGLDGLGLGSILSGLGGGGGLLGSAGKGLLSGLGGGKGLLGGLGGGKGLLGGLGGGKGLLGGLLGKGGVGGLLKNFHLDWDAGDILLILILLFMSIEGEDDEILWILAISLLTGWGDA